MQIRWSDADQVVEVSYRDIVIDTVEAIEAWADQGFPRFEELLVERGGRFPLVIDINGLQLDPRIATEFTERIARPVAARYASAIARYGTPMLTRAVIASETLRRTRANDPQLTSGEQYRANLFDTRAEAVEFALEQHARTALFFTA